MSCFEYMDWFDEQLLRMVGNGEDVFLVSSIVVLPQ